MPELPEVFTIVQQLKNKIVNKTIKEIVLKEKRLIKGITPASFRAQLRGKKIKSILRRGKVIIIKLEDTLSRRALGGVSFLVLHLRISGWITVTLKPDQQARVVFKLSGGQLFNFCDSRLLGEIKLVSDWRTLPLVKTMGPEPLKLAQADFIKLFGGRKGKVKPLLLDQRFLAGIGNIYAQEALFSAGIHPERAAGALRPVRLKKLHQCLTSILKEAIARKGTSADTYRQTNGQDGGYVPLLKVYQRQNQPCSVCQTPLKRKTIGGRGTCFCPRCQK